MIFDLCSLYSISIVNGAAVIGENCCVHPANGTHSICCCKSVLLNVACYLAKLNKLKRWFEIHLLNSVSIFAYDFGEFWINWDILCRIPPGIFANSYKSGIFVIHHSHYACV
jgi:hypothetical protein